MKFFKKRERFLKKKWDTTSLHYITQLAVSVSVNTGANNNH